MSWFEKWVEHKFRQHQQRREEDYKMSSAGQIAIPKGFAKDLGPNIHQNGIRFTVHKATGGFVIETQTYDERTDRSKNGLYVITSDKDIGVEIGKIITLEALKN